MLDFFKIFPLELVLLTWIFVILPTIVAGILRHSLYRYLMDAANKVSRLLSSGVSRGKQPQIVNDLERRFRQASEKLEQVNTVALIDGLYSQERLSFLGISLRCEQWDYFCQTLPNLLLSFGLLGTFIGISSNLYNLSQTINYSSDSVSELIEQLQIPLQNMGIAFFTSLTAIACSSILIGINLRCNTDLAKSFLISSLEDYLDNIFKVKNKGYSRLDVAVDRMVKQQEEFLNRFHEKVGQVLETTIGNAANQMVVANQGFQNNVDSLVSRFNDVSSSLVTSTNNFQDSIATFQSQINTVNDIVPQFQVTSEKLEYSSNIYLEGATKIEKSKFSENLESITTDLATTQKSFSQSTAFLGKQVHKISESHQQATNLAEQVYSQLQQASSKLQDSADGFVKASETIQKTDFADKLANATKELTNIPQQFNESTAILHKSTDSLGRAIDSINTSAKEITNLVQKVNSLNQSSSKLLESSNSKIELETAGFNQIQSELKTIVDKLQKHQEQVNLSLEKFGVKLLDSINTSATEITNLVQTVNNLNQSSSKLLESSNSKIELETAGFNQIQSELKTIVDKLHKHQEQVNIGLEKFGSKLLNSFEQQTNKNTQELNIQAIESLVKRLENNKIEHHIKKYQGFIGLSNTLNGLNQYYSLEGLTQKLIHEAKESKNIQYLEKTENNKKLSESSLKYIQDVVKHSQYLAEIVINYHDDHGCSRLEADILSKELNQLAIEFSMIRSTFDLIIMYTVTNLFTYQISRFQHNNSKYNWNKSMREKMLNILSKCIADY